ncbi:MAG: permease [Trebonia sp.]
MAAAESVDSAQVAQRGKLLIGVAGVLVLAVVFVAGLLWAKWIPYGQKVGKLGDTHTWSGGALFADSGKPGALPTFSGAWHFTWIYLQEVWKGFLVALLVAAVFDALVPRAWLLTVLNRRTRLGQAAAGGAAALPSLMCTCCTSPLAVGLRKRGASSTATLAYWVGNPLLNPAVLVFLFLVAPWQFGVVRILVGVAVVVGGSMLVTRLFGPKVPDGDRPLPPELRSAGDPDPARLGQFPLVFARSLLRLAVVLIPVYLVVLYLLGFFSGWLSDFSGLDARLGIVAVLVCAVLGTLLVIPTGGEIPVILALTAAGVGAGTAGALLITLPALSVPSMVMVGRALSWRITLGMAGVVAVAGLIGGLLLWLLTSLPGDRAPVRSDSYGRTWVAMRSPSSRSRAAAASSCGVMVGP